MLQIKANNKINHCLGNTVYFPSSQGNEKTCLVGYNVFVCVYICFRLVLQFSQRADRLIQHSPVCLSYILLCNFIRRWVIESHVEFIKGLMASLLKKYVEGNHFFEVAFQTFSSGTSDLCICAFHIYPFPLLICGNNQTDLETRRTEY